MKKHMKAIIRQAEKAGDAEITAYVLTHFNNQGFELVAKKDLKAMEKLNKLYKSQIADLVHDNWEIQMRLYEAGLGTADPQNTNVEASKFREETLYTTPAETAGVRRGAEAISTCVDVIINTLDTHIDRITKTLDDANLTRIKYELDEQDRVLDEPMEEQQDPALEEAIATYLRQIDEGYSPYQARLVAMIEIQRTVENSGYESYWIDVYNHLRDRNHTR